MKKRYMLLATIIMALLFAGCQSTGSKTERRPAREKWSMLT